MAGLRQDRVSYRCHSPQPPLPGLRHHHPGRGCHRHHAGCAELYQIRDEYIRSRPVVSIILIDNYEELIKNLSESAISTLNAKLGDTIMAWTESYNGLLRKLERNRYLFIFEKRDLLRATEDKFSLRPFPLKWL